MQHVFTLILCIVFPIALFLSLIADLLINCLFKGMC